MSVITSVITKEFETFLVEDDHPTRLDRFIRRNVTYLSQGVIEKSLRNGQIKLNNKSAKANNRVNKGDQIIISTKLLKEYLQQGESRKGNSSSSMFSPSIISLANKILGQYLIFSCEDFIAINKPNGLAVQGGSKITISVDHALSYLNSIAAASENYRLVHRLDKDTSGVLIIAKNLHSAILLGDAFKNKLLEKTYIALCKVGVISQTTSKTVPQVVPQIAEKGSIESYIAKSKSGVYDLVEASESGKFAKTLYEIVSKNGPFYTIKFNPLTGRMHQLRFHSKQLGCPILGDVKYGGERFERMMLHALELKIPESIFGKQYCITAPIDWNYDY